MVSPLIPYCTPLLQAQARLMPQIAPHPCRNVPLLDLCPDGCFVTMITVTGMHCEFRVWAVEVRAVRAGVFRAGVFAGVYWV